MKDSRAKIIARFVGTFLLLTIAVGVMCALEWRNANYGGATINEMLFHLKVPLEGANTGDFTPLLKYIPISLGTAAVVTIILYLLVGRKKFRAASQAVMEERLAQALAQGKPATALQARVDGRKMTKEERARAKAERKADKPLRKAAVSRFFVRIKEALKTAGRWIRDHVGSYFTGLRVIPAIAGVFTVCVILWGLISINAADYVANFFRAPNTVYEDYYVDPQTVDIDFSETNGRNILWILCESMEVTYQGTATGGAQETDYTPELTYLETDDESVSFTDEDGKYGAKSLSYTDWTMAAIVAQTSGINLQIGDTASLNSYGKSGDFLPGDYSLGEILAEQGYTNEFMCGSDINFGGRDTYLIQHGDYRIFDYYSAIAQGQIPYNYFVFWGFEDNKLFEYAKDEITKLDSEDNPWNMMVLTVDSHYPKGWNDKNSLDNYTDTYLNAVNTSSYEIYQFIEWCKTQDWYENTTIVISGDHPSMGGTYISNLDPEYDRHTYFTIINSAVEADENVHHSFSTFDIFPTVLSSIGAKIDGERLGLGTNLYSEEDTLLDIYGYDTLRDMLDRQSDVYYDWFFLGNKKADS